MSGETGGRRGTGRWIAPLLPALGLLLATAPLPGCYAPQLTVLRSGLDSLRTVVDTLEVRDSISYRVVADTRREIAEQRDIVLSTRATTGTTTQELFEQMGRLERTAPPPAPSALDPAQLYDQATSDLTQGRYGLALQGFREFLRRFPDAELSDNAQYGIGECFFAQSVFDSAATEYGRVESMFPKGDKVPAALYKLALCQDRLGQKAASKSTFEDLVKRFPNSGEAQLARERLGGSRRR